MYYISSNAIELSQSKFSFSSLNLCKEINHSYSHVECLYIFVTGIGYIFCVQKNE